MPMMYVEPELFMEYRGIRIYHAYKERDYEKRLTFWFMLDPAREDEEWC
jgi:hypothetical protein